MNIGTNRKKIQKLKIEKKINENPPQHALNGAKNRKVNTKVKPIALQK